MLLCILLALVGNVFGQYVGDEYPYMRGPLGVDSVTFSPLAPVNPIPMHTRVWYPTREDSYGIWYFIGGYGGAFPSAAYGEIITNVVSHGFIVAGTWPLFGDGGPALSPEDHMDTIEWLKANLEESIPVKPSWEHMTFGCHSAGCSPTYRMAQMDINLAKAVVHIEPVTGSIRDGVDFIQPAVMLGAGIAGSCGGTSMSNFERFYSEWTCPKVKLEVKDVGHCDCLDPAAWDACRTLDICEVGEKSILRRYREFLQGLTTAFMRYYVMGHKDSLKWFTEPELMTMELLQHEYEIDCEDEESVVRH